MLSKGTAVRAGGALPEAAGEYESGAQLIPATPSAAVERATQVLAWLPRHSLRSSAEAPQAHLQAGMPEEYLESRTTDAATWLRTPENIAHFAKFGLEADARCRLIERIQPEPETGANAPAATNQQHRQNPGPGQGRERYPDDETAAASGPGSSWRDAGRCRRRTARDAAGCPQRAGAAAA